MKSPIWRRLWFALAALPLALVSTTPAAAGTWVIVPSPSTAPVFNLLKAVFARTATDAWAAILRR